MLRTRFTELIGVEHPVASAGMGGGGTSVLLFASDDRVDEIVAHEPEVFSTAWPRGGTSFVEQWLGREPELRRRRERLWAQVAAFQEENADDGLMWMGQSAGLIESIEPAADVVREIVAEAEGVIASLGT
jgi:NAD(P)H-dependent flavin oxidoreductase YrpB (nitropropane dioxygenase family)